MTEAMTPMRFGYLSGTATGLAGTCTDRSAEECQEIGRLMLELLNEVKRLRPELPDWL